MMIGAFRLTVVCSGSSGITATTSFTTSSSLFNVKAMQILKRQRAHIGTKDQMWINDGEGNMLVVDRLQPFEGQDLFVLDEYVALVLGKAQHSFAKLQDSFVFVLQRAKRLSFQFQRNDYLR